MRDFFLKAWLVTGWAFCALTSSLCLYALYGLLIYIRNDLTEWASRLITLHRQWLDDRAAAIRSKIVLYAPDERGLVGVAFDGQTFVNLDSQAILEDFRTFIVDPIQEEFHNQRRLLLAASNMRMTADQAKAFVEKAEVPIQWPSRVTLNDLVVRTGTPDIAHLPLGMTAEHGGLYPVCGRLEEMVHVLIGGQTGWGKSTAAAAYFYYMLQTKQVEMCAIDYAGATFTRFHDSGLLYPVAEDPNMAMLLLRQLLDEQRQRVKALRAHPGTESLAAYNILPEVKPMAPIVLFIDEFPALMAGTREIKDPLWELVMMGRKVNVWVTGIGTTFHATVLPTPIRSCFGTRVCVQADVQTSQVILRARTDSFDQKGRALVRLPGQKLTEIQLPIVDDWSKLSHGIPPKRELGRAETIVTGEETRILDFWDEMESPNISGVFWEMGYPGTPGGSRFNKIKRVLKRHGRLQ